MAMIPFEQRMGMLPEEKLQVPCVPFDHITVDVTGPYMLTDMIKQRTAMKVRVVISRSLPVDVLGWSFTRLKLNTKT